VDGGGGGGQVVLVCGSSSGHILGRVSGCGHDPCRNFLFLLPRLFLY
jgi:hypothetical protein